MANKEMINFCNTVRADLQKHERMIRNDITDPHLLEQPDTTPGQTEEVKAQLTLALRSIESARMRLGKAIQYAGDGVSCYDIPGYLGK